MGRKPHYQRPLNDLVRSVCHVELAECANFAEFKEAIRLMVGNLDETLATLALFRPPDARVARAGDDVKLAALRLLQLCRAIPESFEDPEKWREVAVHIAANYEQFRIKAGHFYQAAVPRATFSILRSAL
jgi:hypothetical protein